MAPLAASDRMRAAIYFTPPADHALTRAAAAWLMRDAFSGAASAPVTDPALSAEEITALTAEPRRYGLHATLKAPFRLADGIGHTELDDALHAY